MGQTLCALAAGLLIGQAQDSNWIQVQTTTQTQTWTQTGTWTPATGWTWSKSAPAPVEEHSFLTRLSDKLTGLFSSQKTPATPNAAGHKDTAQAPGPIIRTQAAKVYTGRVTTAEPPLLDVVAEPLAVQSSLPLNVKAASFQPASVQVVGPAAGNGKIHAGVMGRIGHEDDYSWITGQVEIVNGAYIVHYALPESGDRFGGRMILNGEMDLSPIQAGDLITAHGSVLQGRTISLYRVQAVDLIERASK